MAEAPASDGRTDPLEVRIERVGIDLVDWATLKKQSRDLLRRSKDPASCLARMREKTLGFLGPDSGDLGDDLILNKGNTVLNSGKFQTENQKKDPNLTDVRMISEKKIDNSSRLGGEIGSFISSVPVFIPLLCFSRYMYRVQQDVLHQLGWKKGIAADRIVESTVVIFEIKGEEAMILYDKISCFCFFWGFLCHLEKSYESKFEVGVPSGNSSGSSTGGLKNNDSLVVPYGPLDVQMPEAVSVLGKHAAEQSTAAMQANDHKVSVSPLVYVSSDCRGYNFGKGVSSYGELPYASTVDATGACGVQSNEDGKKKQRTTPNRSADPAAAAVQPHQTQ